MLLVSQVTKEHRKHFVRVPVRVHDVSNLLGDVAAVIQQSLKECTSATTSAENLLVQKIFAIIAVKAVAFVVFAAFCHSMTKEELVEAYWFLAPPRPS